MGTKLYHACEVLTVYKPWVYKLGDGGVTSCDVMCTILGSVKSFRML